MPQVETRLVLCVSFKCSFLSSNMEVLSRCLTIFVISCFCQGSHSISLQFDDTGDYQFWNKTYKQGDTIPMKCVLNFVTGEYNQVFDTVKIVKQMTVDGGATYDPTVVANNQVDNNYQIYKNSLGAQRYVAVKFDLPLDGGSAILDFKITDAEAVDSGEYFCELSAGTVVSATQMVQVQVPATQVGFVRIHENGTEESLASGATLDLEEGDMGGIACSGSVDGGLAGVNIPLLALSDSQQQDITSSFSTVMDNSTCTGTVNFECATMSSRRVMNMGSLDVLYMFNAQPITCKAYTALYEDQALSATLTLNLKFKPRINCEQYIIMAVVGEQRSIVCTVSADPLPSGALFNITTETTSDSIAIQLDGSTGVKRDANTGFDISHQITGDMAKITVSIPSIEEKHFTQEYSIYAVNSYGSNERKVYIHKNVAGAAVSLFSSIIILLSSLLISIHHWHSS